MTGHWAGRGLLSRWQASHARRLRVLEMGYGATVTSVSGECVGYLPHVRVAPGVRGIRSVTLHAPTWDEVLGEMEDLVGIRRDSG